MVAADESPTSSSKAEIDYLRVETRRAPQGHERKTSRTPEGEVPPITPEEIALHAVNRYETDIARAQRIAGDAGYDPIFMWQPLMQSAPAIAGRKDGIPNKDRPIWERHGAGGARKLLPPFVHDMSDSLDGVKRPVFDDFYHHNEDAAAIVGKAIVDELEPQLRAPGTPG